MELKSKPKSSFYPQLAEKSRRSDELEWSQITDVPYMWSHKIN